MTHFSKITTDLTVTDIENFFSVSISSQPSTQKLLPSGTYKGQCFDPNPNKETYIQSNTLQNNFRLLDECSDTDEDQDDLTTIDPFGSLISGDMDNIEVETLPPLCSSITDFPDENKRLHVYDRYSFDHVYSSDLPINEHKTEILETINSFPVTVIQGATGSGKTTQVPQFILDEAAHERKHCNIVITQPRKIAAMSIARRVCEERKWEVGYIVGYHVGLDKKASEDTRICYVTTGVLLRQLIKAKNMSNFTHVILDEVHERDQDTDFAMLLVRKLLWLNSRHVKVILMSATLQTDVFAEYFGSPTSGSVCSAPKLTVDGRMFAVEERYLEELVRLSTLPNFNRSNPEICDEIYNIAVDVILYLDKLEVDEQTTNKNAPETLNQLFRGSVLVFLPGLFQIREMEERLNYHKVSKKLTVIPLHSSITLDEQYQVFRSPKSGFRKVIVSTNIAESSITVPDIKYVIDFCLTKAMVCDLDTNYQSLRLQWASKASGIQRAGRAGRVCNGKVFRLVTRDFWENEMDEYAIPEMQRCSLESVILKVKLLDLGDPRSVLSLALSPPDLHNIERTILLLKEIGALSTTADKKRFDGQLTFVGTVLASLPIDMHLGKLVMLGYGFGCFTDCIIIAASLSKPSFFATPYMKTLEAFEKKLYWARGSFSDAIALLNAYKAWYKCAQSQRFLRTSEEKQWCQQNYIQYRRIREVHHQVEELRGRLRQFNIHSDDGDHWSDRENEDDRQLILKVVMAGAFYPNYFLQTECDEIAAVKNMSQLDPARTVAFSGLPYGKAFLYKDSLLQLTKVCGKAKTIYYDGSKAYIEFEKSTNINTGNVLPAVYVSSKLRNVKKKFTLSQTYAEVAAKAGLRQKVPPFLCENLQSTSYKNVVPKPGSPPLFTVHVTHLISATSFWGNKFLPQNIADLSEIAREISCVKSEMVSVDDAMVGSMVLAPYDDGETVAFYRALVTRSHPNLCVWFVDYGNSSDNLLLKDLRKLPISLKEIPFQAVEFRLRGICQKQSVSAEQSKQFLQSVLDKVQHVVMVQVFSVVADVVVADLFLPNQYYLNDLLINKHFCEPCKEGKMSEISHSSWLLAEEKGITDENAFEGRFIGHWVDIDSSIRGPEIPPDRTITVFPPRTTYEEAFGSCINIGRMRSVSVDPNSINSICINQNPGSGTRTMMIAGEIGINQSGSTMLARSTTLMPRIKGMLQFLCVLFAPVVEFRVNSDQTRITGAVCGLGASQTKRGLLSILPDHDIETQFDTEFSVDDLTIVNGIRMKLNIVVGSEDQKASWGQAAVHNMQARGREQLLRLLSKERASVEPLSCGFPFKWGQISEEIVVDHMIHDKFANLKDFYRLHEGVLLRDEHDSRGFI